MLDERGAHIIFLIGQPRSGTTLLQRLLGRHPDIFTYSESWILLSPLFALREGRVVAPAYGARSCAWALDGFLQHCEKGEESYFEAIRAMAGSLYHSCLTATGKKFFLDKSPPYCLVMQDIARLFPDARIIFLLRNPMAVLSSVTQTWFEGKCHLILDHPVHMHSIFCAPFAIARDLKELRGRCYLVRYEDLVAEPERQMQALCRYLGIRFTEEMLSYEPDAGSEERLGDPVGIRRHTRPEPSSLDTWPLTFAPYANYLFALSYLEYLGPDLFSALGYDYAQSRSAITGLWGNRSALARGCARAAHGIRAVYASVQAAWRAARVSVPMELADVWRRYYAPCPPTIPDLSMLEERWRHPVSSMLSRRIPLEEYWPELFRGWRSGGEGHAQ